MKILLEPRRFRGRFWEKHVNTLQYELFEVYSASKGWDEKFFR